MDIIQFIKSYEDGKYGLAGLAKYNKEEVVFKISRHLDASMEHELNVLHSLERLASPHFSKLVKHVPEYPLSHNFKELKNPLTKADSHAVKLPMLLLEPLQGPKFFDIIKGHKCPEPVMIAMLKQVVLALVLAQDTCKFTHYDLHSNNIIIEDCDPNLVHLYVKDEDNQLMTPTFGKCPVLFDFGFSHVAEENFLGCNLSHTENGYIGSHFSSYFDLKMLMVSLAGQLKHWRPHRKFTKVISNIAINVFKNTPTDWTKGYDDFSESRSASEKVARDLRNRCKDKFFRKYALYLTNILQRLVPGELRDVDIGDGKLAFQTIWKEFSPIAKEISSPLFQLYTFKRVVDRASVLRSEYLSEDNSKAAVKLFKEQVVADLFEVSKFCKVQFNAEKLLCGLLLAANWIETLFKKHTESHKRLSEKGMDALPISTPEELYAALEINLPHKYKFTRETIVKTEDFEFEIPDKYLSMLNKCDPLLQGGMLYQIYLNSDQ